jgi:hypothetical protein
VPETLDEFAVPFFMSAFATALNEEKLYRHRRHTPLTIKIPVLHGHRDEGQARLIAEPGIVVDALL